MVKINESVRKVHGQKHVTIHSLKWRVEIEKGEARRVADEFLCLPCTTSGLGPKCLWGSCGFSANKSSAHI